MLRALPFAALAALALLPTAAQASCGGVRHVAAKKEVVPNRAPLAIGDSVLLGAMPQVAREGFEVDVHGCRGFDEGLHVLYARRHAHTLPHLVVLELGADFSISMRQIRAALAITGKRRVLAMLTPREVGGHGGRDAANVRRAGRLYPGHVLVLDWVRHTRGKGSSWFAPDGIHLDYAGIPGLARFMRLALPYAKAGVFPSGGRILS